jgi:2-dehydro-3-deoxygluconokinase
MARFICFGEILIRLCARQGELLLQTPTLNTSVGGAEANVAVSLACLGHDARMVSIVPDNALGRAAIGELRRHGVDTSGVAWGTGRMGLYFLTPGAGQRPADIIYDRAESAFARARAQTINWREALEDADWLHISGVTPALNAATAERALATMHAARAAQVKVSFDANFRSKLWEARGDDPRPTLNALFAEADLLFADMRDIGLATGQQAKDAKEAAGLAFARFPNLERFACKERRAISADHHEIGASMFTRTDAAYVPPRAVSGIVDRIGSGDAFAAGMLHGLATRMSDQNALEFAVAAAAVKHAISGDFNLSKAADIELFLANSGPDVRR